MDPETSGSNRTLWHQRRFIEAHRQPSEIKPLAIRYAQEGEERPGYFTHPEFLRLPLSECPRSQTIDPQHLQRLSKIRYAQAYQRVAQNELAAIRFNMVVADTYFSLGSPEFNVMLHESGEETDHVWTFQRIVREISRELEFDQKGLVRSCDDSGDRGTDAGSWLSEVSRWAFAGVSLSPAAVRRTLGFGEVYLYRRFLSNIFLKCIESYFHRSGSEVDYHPIPVALTQSHAKDEARHFATSLEMGYDLFAGRRNSVRRRVRRILSYATARFIEASFQTQHERYREIAADATKSREWYDYLAIGLRGSDFLQEASPIDHLRRWIDQGWGREPTPVMKLQGKYLARQLAMTIERFELTFSDQQMRSLPFQRYYEMAV